MGKLIGPPKHKPKRQRIKYPKNRKPAVNRKEDASVEAAMAAAGMPVDAGKPKSLTPAELALYEVDRAIASDPTLIKRPQVRWLLKFLSTEKVKNLDGTAVLANGQPIAFDLRETLVRHGIMRFLSRDDPHAYDYWLIIWQTVFGLPRDQQEAASAQTQGIPAPPAFAEDSDVVLAKKMVRATKIAQHILTIETREIEGIEVSGSVVREAVSRANVSPEEPDVVAPPVGQTGVRAALDPAPSTQLPTVPFFRPMQQGSRPAEPSVGNVPVKR